MICLRLMKSQELSPTKYLLRQNTTPLYAPKITSLYLICRRLSLLGTSNQMSGDQRWPVHGFRWTLFGPQDLSRVRVGVGIKHSWIQLGGPYFVGMVRNTSGCQKAAFSNMAI